MAKEAESIGANTFQFFTRNPRGGKAKEINPTDIERYLAFAKMRGIDHILAHAPYTLNACSADEGLREFAKNTMADDLMRMEYTPGNCYNFHPGSHVGQGVEAGITFISDMLNSILTPEQNTIVLLETMAGKGSEIGRSFEELRELLYKMNVKIAYNLDGGSSTQTVFHKTALTPVYREETGRKIPTVITFEIIDAN